MALQKSIQHQSGSFSTYWKIIKTDFSHSDKSGLILLAGYITEQARQDQKRHLDIRTFRVYNADFDTYFSSSALDPQDINPVKQSYIYIKNVKNGEFSDAIDV
jgi:hypothetical protein